jgi:GrpB-like predicted nucleotidyltransferase (UPF0157 family)
MLVAMTDASRPEFLTPPVRVDGPITLAEANPAWPEQFAREEERIRGALGARALQIEHVGSTSVPGLAAKPIIDIVLVVADTADEAAYVPDLEAAGYVLHARDFHPTEHRLLTDHNRAVQVHVLTVGDPEVQRMLLFRDRLRRHPADRSLYERTKLELAARRWAYVQDYADAKSSVVEGIIDRAGADRDAI